MSRRLTSNPVQASTIHKGTLVNLCVCVCTAGGIKGRINKGVDKLFDHLVRQAVEEWSLHASHVIGAASDACTTYPLQARLILRLLQLHVNPGPPEIQQGRDPSSNPKAQVPLNSRLHAGLTAT